METPITTPSWLSDNVPDLSPVSRQVIDLYPTSVTLKEEQEAQFSRLFVHVMNKVAEGVSFEHAVIFGPYQTSPVALMRWIRKSPERLKDLEETQAAMAEINMMNLIRTAAAEGSMEDAQRTKLKLDATVIQSTAYNRRKFSKDQTGMVNGGGPSGPITINITPVIATHGAAPLAEVVEVIEVVENEARTA